MEKYYLLEPLKIAKMGKETSLGGGVTSQEMIYTGVPFNSYRLHECNSLDELKIKKEQLEKKVENEEGSLFLEFRPVLVVQDISDLL